VTVSGDCPLPTEVSVQIQKDAAKELEKLPLNSKKNIETILTVAMKDRDKLRACRKIR
jgi:hypothetical protein